MNMVCHRSAQIMIRQGRRFWRCPSCNKVLAEIDGRHVVIKVGHRFLVIALVNDQTQRCPNPRCGAESVLRADMVA